MSVGWESTMLLRVAGEAHVRYDTSGDGREIQGLIECRRCHRGADWLIAATGAQVEVACRCGHRWRIAASLEHVVGLAESQPMDPQWTCLADAQEALGFTQHQKVATGLRRRGHKAAA